MSFIKRIFKKVFLVLIATIMLIVSIPSMQIVWAAPKTPILTPGTSEHIIAPVISSPFPDNDNKNIKMKVPVVEWEKFFGITESDDFGTTVQQTTDGGYIITGYTDLWEIQDLVFGTSVFKPDIYLVKTGADGSKQWEKTFGGANADIGYSVQQTKDGGYIIAGITSSSGAGGYDVYLIKTDASGNKQWEKTFGGANADIGYSVQQTKDGGYIIIGTTNSTGAGGGDVYLIKTGADGSKQWEKTFGGAGDDEGYSVQQTKDGGYIITGYILTGYTIVGYSPGYTVSSNTKDNVYLIKTGADGSMQWEKTIVGEKDSHGKFVQQTADGGYIITGEIDTPQVYNNWNPVSDIYMVKTDADGNKQWEKTIGGRGDDIGYSVRQTIDGGYVIAGSTSSSVDGESNAYLVKTDASGNTQWEKSFGGSLHDEGYSVQQTTDGGYIIAGNATLFSGCHDLYLIKIKMEDYKPSVPAPLTNDNVTSTPGAPAVEWEKTFKHSSGNDYGRYVQQTTDGGYIITGNTTLSLEGGWSMANGVPEYVNPYCYVYLVKTGADGSKQWEKTFGGANYAEGYSVQQTKDGGYIITGYTKSFNLNTLDVYLIKTDKDGIKQWEKTFGGIKNDKGYFVQQTTDEGYIIAGTTASSGAGENDVYLIKTDANGNKLWEKVFGGAGYDEGYSVQQTTDGGYIITGKTGGNVYLVKTDATGSKQWEKTFSGTIYAEGYSVQQTIDGGYIIAGNSKVSEERGLDIYLVKTDSGGNKQWEKTYGGIRDDEGYSVHQTKDSGYSIAGYTRNVFGNNDIGENIYIVKTGEDGSMQWEKVVDKSISDKGYSMQQTKDGGYIIAGNSFDSNKDASELYLLKIETGVTPTVEAVVPIVPATTERRTPAPLLEAPTERVSSVTSWTGIWDTSYGELKFDSPMRNQITGHYYNNVGTLTGTVSVSAARKTVLKGTYIEGSGDDIRKGFFEFTLSSDKLSFTGFWRSEEDDPLSQVEWNGDRASE